MDAKSGRNMYSDFAVASKHTVGLHQVGFLYISLYIFSQSELQTPLLYGLSAMHAVPRANEI